MDLCIVDTAYRQFYVADIGLAPAAPEEWTEQHIEQRFNAQKNIVALVPEGDVTARIGCLVPGEVYAEREAADFTVETQVTIESGRLGVVGWPWEVIAEWAVEPGLYRVVFHGCNLRGVDEETDYYVIESHPA